MKAQLILICFLLIGGLGFAQEKAPAQKASPPDSSKVTTSDGVTIEIKYSSPALKGRQIGIDVAQVGQRWRTGANETTTISFDKNVTINGENLMAGKYGLHTIPGENQTVIIFNKIWKQWGTKYDEKDDALRFIVDNETRTTSQERLKITADKSGKIQINWGTYGLSMMVKAAK